MILNLCHKFLKNAFSARQVLIECRFPTWQEKEGKGEREGKGAGGGTSFPHPTFPSPGAMEGHQTPCAPGCRSLGTLGPAQQRFCQRIGTLPDLSCSLQLFHLPKNLSVEGSAKEGSPESVSSISSLRRSSALCFYPCGVHRSLLMFVALFQELLSIIQTQREEIGKQPGSGCASTSRCLE